MKVKGKFFKAVKSGAAVLLVLTAVVCVIRRVPQVFSERDTALAAAAFTLTDGKVFAGGSAEPSSAPAVTESTSPAAAVAETVALPNEKRDKTGYYDSFGNHSGEARYAVTEKTIYPDGTEVDGCYVKNYTGLDMDFAALLREPLPFQTRSGTEEPQVLIYHTHTSEGYLDEDVDYYYESFYSRTGNRDYNVVATGEAIAAELRRQHIAVLHDETVHDSTYNGSYDRSAQTVKQLMQAHPSIKVVLDIHRDALGAEDYKVKTVFEHDGKKGAQIMILSGCDPDNERGFVNWQHNLNFALKLQHAAERRCPGMTRPLDFGCFAYNEYICDGSLLIEVGTDANTADEAAFAGQMLAQALAEVLSDKS